MNWDGPEMGRAGNGTPGPEMGWARNGTGTKLDAWALNGLGPKWRARNGGDPKKVGKSFV